MTDATSGAADAAVTPPPAAPEPLYCANHPGVETLLRCNRCGKPICLKCAKLTDVGYRCNECIRGVQAAYFNAVPTDSLIAFAVALIVTALAAPFASVLLRFFGLFFGLIIAFLIGGGAGGILAQIIRRAISRRRGRYLPFFALGGIVLGLLLGVFVASLVLGFPLFGLLFNPAMLVFLVLAAGSTYQLLR